MIITGKKKDDVHGEGKKELKKIRSCIFIIAAQLLLFTNRNELTSSHFWMAAGFFQKNFPLEEMLEIPLLSSV